MTASLSKPILRAYQNAAVESIVDGFRTYNRQLLVAATGAGKTQIFCEVIRRSQPKKSLVLCHREELIAQACRRLDAFGISAEVEQADCRAKDNAPAVVASVQTLMRDDRLTRWSPDHFELVVADEAHKSISDSWQKVLRYFDQSARVLGASATPERSDKRNLGRYFENIAFEIGLLDLIKQNWLAPIQVKTVPLQIDLDGCRTTAGDWNAEDVGHALEPYLERIASVLYEHRHRKTLVFLPLIAISQQLAKLCRELGMAAEHIDGQSRDRQEILERFKHGRTTLLTNAMLLTEGYDEPSIDCIVCLRPTQVRSLYSQIVGRGTRIYPGKDHLLILDFLWLAEEHSLIKPAHLIAVDEAEADAITEALETDGDLESAKETAEADRAAKLRERLERNRTRTARSFDAMEFALSLGDTQLADYVPTMRWHEDEPTGKQRAILERFGLDSNSIQTKGHASALLDRLFLRSQLGLATAKQVRWLQQIGYAHPEQATFDEARAFLSNWANRKVTRI